MAELHVELVAADRKVWSGKAGLVVARTTSGDIGVMPGHQPLLGVLEPGAVVIRTAGESGEGTVAAAVTQFNGMVTSAPPQPDRTIAFDRPFHYQIVHAETGLPLFMGTVADPR